MFHPDKSVCKPGFEINYVVFVRFAGCNLIHCPPAVRVAECVKHIITHCKVKAVFVDNIVNGVEHTANGAFLFLIPL